MVDFSSILQAKVEEVKEPKPLAPGTYHASIADKPNLRELNTKNGPAIIATITYALHEASEDVDPELLADCGGLTNGSGGPRTIRADYWYRSGVDGAAGNFDWDLASMVKSLGHEEGSWADIFEKLTGEEVTLQVKHRAAGDKIFAEVKNVTARA